MANRPEPQAKPVGPFPPVTTHITGHDPSTVKAIVQSSTEVPWAGNPEKTFAMSTLYSTSSFPATLTSDADIKTHNDLLASGTLGLVNRNGTVLRMLDMAPGYVSIMHRTQSLDYGIVMEGSVEMLMDSGESKILKRGDVAVQRATMHAWRNPSETEWTRMYFVLQECEKPVVGGQELGEDLTSAGTPGKDGK